MNAELIQRLRFQTRYTVGQVPVTMDEAADALEAADKRMAELEAEGEALEQARLLGMSAERECALLGKLGRTERKLAVAREALQNTEVWMLTLTADECPDTAYIPVKDALAQIGGDDAG